MNKTRLLARGLLTAAALSAVGFGVWLAALPPAPAPAVPPVIGAAEQAAALASLKPPKRARPLVAVVGLNDGTETTDYLMSYGILKRADVADVVALAAAPGPVSLYPALTVEAQATLADFDARHPGGADYVVVPAMIREDDPVILAWLRAQADKGATVIGVCVGAMVVAKAGLLDGKSATTHWYSVGDLRSDHPEVRYVPDRRIVTDAGVATTTGITASMPAMLTLIEAIAGREKAQEVAAGLGVPAWDVRHDSAAFRFNRPFAVTALSNRLAFWRHETLGLALTPGIDEVALALVADAWSRTYRSRARTFAQTGGTVETRGGLRIVPDATATAWPADRRLPDVAGRPPAAALDAALRGIASRYGAATESFVAMQLEYPQRY